MRILPGEHSFGRGRFVKWELTRKKLRVLVECDSTLVAVESSLQAYLPRGRTWCPAHVNIGSIEAIDPSLCADFLKAVEAAFPIVRESRFKAEHISFEDDDVNRRNRGPSAEEPEEEEEEEEELREPASDELPPPSGDTAMLPIPDGWPPDSAHKFLQALALIMPPCPCPRETTPPYAPPAATQLPPPSWAMVILDWFYCYKVYMSDAAYSRIAYRMNHN